MENMPTPPRQRNRRSERHANPAPPAQWQQPAPPAQPMQQYPMQQYPMQQPMQQYPAQPVQHPMQQYPARPVQQPLQQYPAQQRPAQQPPRRPAAATSPAAARTEQPRRPAAAPGSVPRALQARPQQRSSGWQTPSLNRSEHDLPPQEETSVKLPSWMVTSLTVMLLVVMALVAGHFLLKAWLKTDADARQLAYEKVLNNYHVTRSGDDTLRVTWQDTIEYYAAQYNLQPAFVTAIIRNESSFRTDAVSSIGARGLMQMVSSTAEWIAGKLDDDSYTFDRMFDGETNIRYGCWYLGYLSELFQGDPVLVSAAFHAGQGEVRSWLGNPQLSPDGKTVPIDRIPIAQTKQYAGRVTQAYGIYQNLLYPSQSFDTAQSVLAADGADAGAAADR